MDLTKKYRDLTDLGLWLGPKPLCKDLVFTRNMHREKNILRENNDSSVYLRVRHGFVKPILWLFLSGNMMINKPIGGRP